jgi:hypothetical protein
MRPAGRRVSTCNNVIWQRVRDCVHGVVCVGLVANNSHSTYRICILCDVFAVMMSPCGR